MSHLRRGGWAWGRLAATTCWVKLLPLVRDRGIKLLLSIAPRPALGYLHCWTTRKRFVFQQECFSVSILPHRCKPLSLWVIVGVCIHNTWGSLSFLPSFSFEKYFPPVSCFSRAGVWCPFGLIPTQFGPGCHWTGTASLSQPVLYQKISNQDNSIYLQWRFSFSIIYMDSSSIYQLHLWIPSHAFSNCNFSAHG